MTKCTVIAHRGASGYLPEHTLEAKALGHAMGAHYLEQDIVASRDDQLLVMHDIHLDRISNVAEMYPDRARDDGRWYARDFDLCELRVLNVYERFDESGNAVYPERYPAGEGEFRFHTLREEIGFVRHLNSQSEHQAGLYTEIKRPLWHRNEGVDIAPELLRLLTEEGFKGGDDVVLQCFDPDELRRLRHELKSPFRQVQLIGENDWGESDADYLSLRSADGLDTIASYADGIGPWLPHCYSTDDESGQPVSSQIVADAHSRGLIVHPYTFRRDDLPKGFADFQALLDFFINGEHIDGLFTDFPDLAVAAI